VTAAGADLVYFCDWLPPDFGAVGQYALQFARERARRGERVALYGLSSTAASVEHESSAAGSLKTVRLKARTYDRARVLDRALWTACTNVSLLLSAWRDLRGCKEIVFTGSPPFMLHLLAPLNCLLRKKLTYRITDFFPECLMAERPAVPLLLRALYRLTLFWRRRITQFEVLGEDQRVRLLAAGMPASRIVLKRDPSPVAIAAGTLPLERPQALRGYRILLYSGNYGVAHDYRTIHEAYREHHRRGKRGVALWLNAVGSRADLLEDALRRDGLPVLRSRPVPLHELPSLLVTPDAHLITLLDSFWGFVLPSKVYGCIESGRPVLYIGPEASDVHLLCSSRIARGSYTRADVGDAESVFRALELMST
jgi:hypothetical protein